VFSQPSQGTLYESSYGPVLSGIHHQTMTAPLDPVTFTQALNELGVTTAALHAIRMSVPERARLLIDELKAIAKSRFRLLAKSLHPDVTGNDAAKTAKFSFLAIVMKEIDKMEAPMMPQRPPPITIPSGTVPQQHIRIVFQPRIVVQAVPASHAAPSSTRGPNGVHVVNMKPG